MIYIVLAIFIYLLIKTKRSSIGFWIVLIYILSLIISFFLGNAFEYAGFFDILHAIWVICVLFLLITPWGNYSNVNHIIVKNLHGIDLFAKYAGALCIIMAVGCLILAWAVSQVVTDIDVFKYRGEQQDVYASIGLNMKPFLLAYIFYPVSHLFIPLIFYYLQNRRFGMALWCFFASLASVAHGLAYFSRAHTAHYIMLLVVFYIFLKGTLPSRVNLFIKKVGVLVIVLAICSFMAISFNRFEQHEYEQNANSLIKNNVAYSMADYYSQWWRVSRDVCKKYDFQTFNGDIALQSLYKTAVICSFGHIKGNEDRVALKREKFLGEHRGSFLGVSAYFLYDMGIIISLVVLAIYNIYVRKIAPKGNTYSIERLMYMTIFLLLPLFGVFYSVHDVVLQLLFYWVGIKLIFLRGGQKNKVASSMNSVKFI